MCGVHVRILTQNEHRDSSFPILCEAYELFICRRPVDARHAKIRRPRVLFGRQERRDAH